MKKHLAIFLLLSTSVDIVAQKPIILDEIHYTVSDSSIREVANNYFKTFYKGRLMAEQAVNPLPFIDFISVRPDESSISISIPGPFPGVEFGDQKQRTRELVKPSPLNPPMYGVRWLAFNTKSIRKTIKSLVSAGYQFAIEDFYLPTEPGVNAVAIYGFDYNIFVLVERPKMKKQKTEFGIDHLQLLVKNLEENVRFFQTVLAAEIIEKKERSTVLKIGNHKFILSEPEALGLVREQVVERDPTKNVANIDHLGFLYDEIEPAFYGAKANNYRITMEPKTMIYYDKPTPYMFCVLMSPDNLQIELEQEDGRTSSRKIYKKEEK